MDWLSIWDQIKSTAIDIVAMDWPNMWNQISSTDMVASDWFSIWNLTRSAGLIAYVLLSLSVLTGLYATVRKKNEQKPGVFPMLHNSFANGALYISMFHVAILFFDTYTNLSWQEILIPFSTTYKEMPMAIGIIGFYLLIFTIITTELRYKIGNKIWRALHMLTPIMYVLATVHGIWIGTSSQAVEAILMYGISALGVITLLLMRFAPVEKATEEVGV